MAKITLEKAVISGAVGLLDIGVKQLDATYGAVLGPMTPSHITETLLALGSAGVNLAGIETERSEIVFYSSLPLFEGALASLIRGAMAAPTVRAVSPGSSSVRTSTSTTGRVTAKGSYRVTA